MTGALKIQISEREKRKSKAEKIIYLTTHSHTWFMTLQDTADS